VTDPQRDDPQVVARDRERERQRQPDREEMHGRHAGAGKVDAFAAAQEMVVPGATPGGFHHDMQPRGQKESFFQRYR